MRLSPDLVLELCYLNLKCKIVSYCHQIISAGAVTKHMLLIFQVKSYWKLLATPAVNLFLSRKRLERQVGVFFPQVWLFRLM